MFKKLMLGLGFAASATSANDRFDWPELPTTGFIAGREAVNEDTAYGRAIFSLDGKSAGPIAVTIPQYALWRDEDGVAHPVILMQAETAPDGTQIVGLRNFDGSDTVATMPEITLLGVDKPN
jgi:hypothetical protein